MNDEAARQGRPATTSTAETSTGARRNRGALIAILEALEVGNNSLATEILMALVEGLDEPDEHRVHCSGCGRGFAWQGLLDAHLDTSTTCLRWAA